MIAAVVTGNIGRDGEFTVASRHFEKGEERTLWTRVSFWGQRAAKLAPHIRKGGRIAARGSLSVREYIGKDGKAFSLEMRADDVELLGKPEGDRPAVSTGTQHRTVSAREAYGPGADDDGDPF
jgi:single-stranded DNA-binding protein